MLVMDTTAILAIVLGTVLIVILGVAVVVGMAYRRHRKKQRSLKKIYSVRFNSEYKKK